ncbi:MmgE/PrpD family protein [Rhodococcus sp. NPDC003322]
MVECVHPGRSAEVVLATESSGLCLEQVPADVVDAAVDFILDTLAVTFGGGSEDVVRLAARVADDRGACVRVTDSSGAGSRSAALINGTAAHVLDFDDWLPAAGIHPSAPLLPAVLAQAQAQGARGSAEIGTSRLLAAYISGFEAQARIGAALAPEHYAMGFHPTATVGIFGAATGAGYLLGLGPAVLQHAWGFAATQAAGLRMMFGTMGKALHVGRASEAGVFAAQLAAAGATAPSGAIFGLKGFAATHGHTGDVGPLTVPFAERWYLREALVKRHAACFGTHAAVNALLLLRNEIELDLVREIELTVPELMRTVCAIQSPATPLEGKFSLAFVAALALVRGSCQVADFTEEAIHDESLRSVAERVRVSFDPSMKTQETHVRVVLDGQKTLEGSSDSSVPVTPQERHGIVREKFRALVGPVLGLDRCSALLAAVENLPAGGSVSELTTLLHPG